MIVVVIVLLVRKRDREKVVLKSEGCGLLLYLIGKVHCSSHGEGRLGKLKNLRVCMTGELNWVVERYVVKVLRQSQLSVRLLAESVRLVLTA